MIEREHGNCAGYCLELVREANDVERHGLNTDARMLAHAVFSVGAVVAQLLEEIAAASRGALPKKADSSEKTEVPKP